MGTMKFGVTFTSKRNPIVKKDLKKAFSPHYVIHR
jgi:hypothetical protein